MEHCQAACVVSFHAPEVSRVRGKPDVKVYHGRVRVSLEVHVLEA